MTKDRENQGNTVETQEASSKMFVELLGRRQRFLKEGGLIKERELVAKAENECRQREEQIKKELETALVEAKRPRIEIEQNLEGALRRYLKIGNSPPHLRRFERTDYVASAQFGFTLEETIELLEFALVKDIDPEIFLGHCETTRRILQLGPNPVFLNIIGYGSDEVVPALGEIETEYQQGVQKLAPKFKARLEQEGIQKVIQEAGPYFNNAKELLENLTDLKVRVPWKEATKVFLEFMTSESCLVFAEPTCSKNYYKRFSYKLP